MVIYRCNLVVGFASLCLFISSIAAYAADSPFSPVEEILVTAQKRLQSADDVPIAISVFSGEDLHTLGLRDARDLGALVPGLTVSDSGFNTPVFTLRGVGFNDTTYTASSTVGSYLDEFSLPYSIMSKGATLDLERVEVLKGPQGILYGRNTTGGAINFIASKPTENLHAGVRAGYGRFARSDVEAHISGPVAETVGGRLAVRDVRSQQGWQYSHTRPGDTLGKEDKQALRGILQWQLGDALGLQWMVNAWSDRSEPRAAQAIFYNAQLVGAPTQRAEAYPYISQRSRDPQRADWPSQQGEPFLEWQLDDRFWLNGLRADWAIADDLELTVLLSQARMVSDESKIPQTGFDFDNSEQNITAEIDSLSFESRLAGKLADDTVGWLVGMNVSDDEGREYHDQYIGYQSAALASPATGGRSLSDRIFFYGDNEVRQYAVFFNLDWQLNEAFRVAYGMRHTRQEERFIGCSGEPADVEPLNAGGPTFIQAIFPVVSQAYAAMYQQQTGQPGNPQSSYTSGSCATVAEDGSFAAYQDRLDEENISYRVALDWQPKEDAMIYLALGRGYKAGSFPVLTAATQGQLEPVTQEKLEAVEIGAKLRFLDDRLRSNFAIYRYRYTDKQLLGKSLDPIFGPLPVLKNVPKSRVQGAELEASYRFRSMPGLGLDLSAAYTDTEVRKFIGYNTDGSNPQFDYSGQSFNFAPNWELGARLSYARPVSEDLNLSVSVDYSYTDDTNSTLDNDPWYAHNTYQLWGGRLSLQEREGAWQLAVFARNITNEFVTASVFRNGDGVSRLVGMPRVYGVEIAYTL